MYPETMEDWEKERQKERERQERIYRYIQRCEDSVRFFLEETPGFAYDPAGKLSSQELYALYQAWCQQEKLPVKPRREVFLYVKKHASRYQLIHSTHIPVADGKRVRGFLGIRRTDGPYINGETPMLTNTVFSV